MLEELGLPFAEFNQENLTNLQFHRTIILDVIKTTFKTVFAGGPATKLDAMGGWNKIIGNGTELLNLKKKIPILTNKFF